MVDCLLRVEDHTLPTKTPEPSITMVLPGFTEHSSYLYSRRGDLVHVILQEEKKKKASH